MRKLTALLLTLILAFSLAACDDNSGTPAGEGKNEGTSKISFTEETVIDNDECSITITGIDPDDIWGYTLKTQLENKSSEKTYVFFIDYAAVNGVVCDPLLSTDVAAGKKANADINISDDSFAGEDIGDYTDIALKFRVYDDDDWSADPVAEEVVHIYPYGEDKATKFVREQKDSDNVIAENNDVKATVLSCAEDDFWAYKVSLYIENKTDKNLLFSADDVSVNGSMADPYFAISIPAGSSTYAEMGWNEELLAENNITQIEEIEFKFKAFDEDNWNGKDFIGETVTLNP